MTAKLSLRLTRQMEDATPAKTVNWKCFSSLHGKKPDHKFRKRRRKVGGNRNNSWGLKRLRHGQTCRPRIQPGSRDVNCEGVYLSNKLLYRLKRYRFVAKQIFSTRRELNLVIKGHQERGFSRVYDVPQKDWRLRGEKGRLFKANKVAKINEDAAGHIMGCLSTLKTRPGTRRSGTPDLKFTKMTVVYILRTWDAKRRNVASGDQTDRMIKVRTSLPFKGESVKNKVPSIPLKTKVRPTVWRKMDMVIPTSVIARGLEAIVMDVTGKVSNKIQEERNNFDPQVEKSLIMAHVGL